MPVVPPTSYPGVYVQEVPSGVRTIAGVSTSIAAFIGRAKRGELFKPVLCLSYSDFNRVFSSEFAGSDMHRQVRLFFQNGGTQCYVLRIADDTAKEAAVTLRDENNSQDVLTLTAKSAGDIGDAIRVAVKYNANNPEGTFDIEVFRWEKTSGGTTVKADAEVFQNLSMNPNSARYAKDVVTQNSKLVNLSDEGASAAATGYSQSGRPVTDQTATTFTNAWKALIGKDGTANNFRLFVDDSSPADIVLSGIDFDNDFSGVTDTRSNLATRIQNEILPQLPAGTSVTVSMETGPDDENGNNTVLLRIDSANGDVRIQPASTDDAAVPLMLGAAQGGIEVSKYALNRPAPTGLVFDLDAYIGFAELDQTAFNTITIDGTDIDLNGALETSSVSGAKMYQDGYSSSNTENSDGIREKLNILASQINAERSANPNFKWTAEVWGTRLALIPGSVGDNIQGSIATSNGDGEDIGPGDLDYFIRNVRYFSLGVTGQGSYQVSGVDGQDGGAPALSDYRDAFKKIDKEVDLFNLMLLPKDHDHTADERKSLWGPASTFCQEQRAFLLMDPPGSWDGAQAAIDPSTGVNSLRMGLVNDHSAIFYPRITINEDGRKVNIGPSGAIAGVMARIDSSRGVWKAPAGTEATLRGVVGLEQRFSDSENGVLNPDGINTLRVFPNGIVNWGARTMDGDDDFASEYKYIPVRRIALFMGESLYRGLKWVVFEPNDEPLWAQIRLNVGAFMHNLFRQGAFQGTTPKQAYFVKCDSETTTQNDIDLGRVNIWVGFAPLKPAEFVILYLQQMAGQVEV